MQIHKLATIAPGDVLGSGHVVDDRGGSQPGPAIATVRYHCCCLFRHAHNQFFLPVPPALVNIRAWEYSNP